MIREACNSAYSRCGDLLPRFLTAALARVRTESWRARQRKVGEWQSLFDGESLQGWQNTPFTGRGEFESRREPSLSDREADDGSDMDRIISAVRTMRSASRPLASQETTFSRAHVSCSGFVLHVGHRRLGRRHRRAVQHRWVGRVRQRNQNLLQLRKRPLVCAFALQVTDDRIMAWIDEKPVINVAIAGRSIGLRHGEIKLSAPFGFASYGTDGALRKIEYRLLKAPAGAARLEQLIRSASNWAGTPLQIIVRFGRVGHAAGGADRTRASCRRGAPPGPAASAPSLSRSNRSRSASCCWCRERRCRSCPCRRRAIPSGTRSPARAGAPLFSASRIVSTLVFGRPRAAGILPSTNWISGNPFGPGCALGIAVNPAGRRLAAPGRGPAAGRAAGDGLRRLARAADQRKKLFCAAALVVRQIAVVVVRNDHRGW